MGIRLKGSAIITPLNSPLRSEGAGRAVEGRAISSEPAIEPASERIGDRGEP